MVGSLLSTVATDPSHGTSRGRGTRPRVTTGDHGTGRRTRPSRSVSQWLNGARFSRVMMIGMLPIQLEYPTSNEEGEILERLESLMRHGDDNGRAAIALTNGDVIAIRDAMRRAARGDRLIESVARTRRFIFDLESHSCVDDPGCVKEFEDGHLTEGQMCSWQARRLMGDPLDQDLESVNGELFDAIIAYTGWDPWSVAFGSQESYKDYLISTSRGGRVSLIPKIKHVLRVKRVS